MAQLAGMRFWLLATIALGLQTYLFGAESKTRLPQELSTSEQYLFSTTNQERAARGLPLLHTDVSLMESAARHARMTAERDDITISSPESQIWQSVEPMSALSSA